MELSIILGAAMTVFCMFIAVLLGITIFGGKR